MSEEIFGDKSPHQVSVSEGSGNAGSSRGRSGKFKADSSRRISVNAQEGEIVSRHIQQDPGAGLGADDGQHLTDEDTDGQGHDLAPDNHSQNDGSPKGPLRAGEPETDHLVQIEGEHSDENRLTLPASDKPEDNLAHIDQDTEADNVVALPLAQGKDDNLAKLPSEAVSDHRVSLPSQGPGADDEPLITDADVLHRAGPVQFDAANPSRGLTKEASSIPHSEALAKVDSDQHPSGPQLAGHSPHHESVPTQGLEDHHVPLPGNEATPEPAHAHTTQALHDHHEALPGTHQDTHVQHLNMGRDGLREFDIHGQGDEPGQENPTDAHEMTALAHTHMEGEVALAMADAHEESHPPPQAIKLQADLWREGFRGRVAQIREQVALINENLDKLEQ